jgi:hypothetical protein
MPFAYLASTWAASTPSEKVAFRWNAPYVISGPAIDGSSNWNLHVLVASPLSNVCCRELREIPGENVVVTKTGLNSDLEAEVQRLVRLQVVAGP